MPLIRQKSTPKFSSIVSSDVTKTRRIRVPHSKSQNFSHHFNGLPNEVLCEIFKIYVGNHNAQQELPAWSTLDIIRFETTPTKLTHVCQRWRTLMLGTPYFWSRIEVTANDLSDVEVSRVCTWLARTASCPLHITIHQAVRRWDADLTDTDTKCISTFLDILSILIEQMALWKSIDISFPIHFIDDFVRLVKATVAQCTDAGCVLEHATVGIDMSESNWPSEDPLSGYNWNVPRMRSLLELLKDVSPQLRSVTMSTRLSGAMVIPVDILTPEASQWMTTTSWTRLTHLTFDFPIELLELVHTLMLCPKAQVVVASDVRERGTISSRCTTDAIDATPILPLVLTELHTLKLQHTTSINSLFQCSTFPSLSTLYLKGTRQTDIEDSGLFSAQTLERFLRRSDCRLKKLRMAYEDIEEYRMRDILSVIDVRRLTHLALVCSFATLRKIFGAHSVGSDRHTAHLQELHLGSCFGFRADIHIQCFVEDRCLSGHDLRLYGCLDASAESAFIEDHVER